MDRIPPAAPFLAPSFVLNSSQPSSVPASPKHGCHSSPFCGLAVMSFKFLQWQVELNRVGRGILARGESLPGRPVQIRSRCILKRAPWLQSLSAKRRVSSSIPGTFCPCAKAKVRLHFWCPGTCLFSLGRFFFCFYGVFFVCLFLTV